MHVIKLAPACIYSLCLGLIRYLGLWRLSAATKKVWGLWQTHHVGHDLTNFLNCIHIMQAPWVPPLWKPCEEETPQIPDTLPFKPSGPAAGGGRGRGRGRARPPSSHTDPAPALLAEGGSAGGSGRGPGRSRPCSSRGEQPQDMHAEGSPADPSLANASEGAGQGRRVRQRKLAPSAWQQGRDWDDAAPALEWTA